jgi:hypothetical protein
VTPSINKNLAEDFAGEAQTPSSFRFPRKPVARDQGLTRTSRAVLVALCGILTVCFLFRYQILSDFRFLNGDRYDQVIEISILEHWFNALRGFAHWSETGYFFPYEKTLGYNDGYFVYGLVYSLFRLARIDPYLSAECVSAVVRAVGFYGLYLAARRLLDLGPGWATLAAVVFTLSNNAFVQASHAQLVSVGFAPVLAVLLHGMAAALRSERRASAVAYGVSAACFYAAWLLTAFYMAWFFAFFSAFAALSSAVLTGRAGLRAAFETARRNWVPLAIVCAAFVLAALPFLSVYLAKAHETGMHPYRAARTHTLSLPDLFEVGHGNLLYGQAMTLFDHALRPSYPEWDERMTGFPPILLFLFGCGGVALFTGPKALSKALGIKDAALLRVLAVASLLTWACAFNIGGHSLWWLVYEAFPGAKATRIVSRYPIFIAAPVIAVAVSYLAASARTMAAPLLCLICALLVMEEISAAPLVALDRTHELARLQAVPTPPAECKAFFVSNARPEHLLDAGWDGFYSHNVDAMIIAETRHLPTVNGASTFQPPGWNLVNPDTPDYLSRIRKYAAENSVNGLCGLDLRTMTWNSAPFASDSQAITVR